MSLQTAFYSAKSALLANAAQTSIVSRNIAGANESGYARRLALVESVGEGGVRVVSVERAADMALRDSMMAAGSSAARDNAVSSALSSLQQTVGDPQSATSPAALVGALRDALIQATAAPQDAPTLGAAASAVRQLATALNTASQQVQAARTRADGGMAESVATINSLLGQFGAVNTAIIAGRAAGADTTDQTDRRDAILGKLSEQIGISTVEAPNGALSIFTDSGATLFQGDARKVSMQPTQTFAAGVAGNSVFVDGVAITGPSATMPARTGALAGLARVRDATAPVYQKQLDEIARGLIGAFVQTDQSGGAAPPRTGAFTWSGGPALPAGQTDGLAASIAIDPTLDPAAGGDPTLLRDGGIGAGASSVYVYNTKHAASYTDRLTGLADKIEATASFGSATELPVSASVASYATGSVAWLESARKTASDAAAQSSVTASQTASALSNAIGVNIDDQMSQMLDLEHSYQASAKMMASVDTMYSNLFSALGAR